MTTTGSFDKRRVGVGLLALACVLYAVDAQTQGQPPPSAVAVMQAADRAVMDAEKALELAAPAAYRAWISAMQARSQTRAFVDAQAKVTGSK